MSTISLATPEGTGPWPGVAVVHDAIGYGPDNEAVSARIVAAKNITADAWSRVFAFFGEHLRSRAS